MHDSAGRGDEMKGRSAGSERGSPANEGAGASKGPSSAQTKSPADTGRGNSAQKSGADRGAPMSSGGHENNSTRSGAMSTQGNKPSAQNRGGANSDRNSEQTTGMPAGGAGREAATNITTEERTKLRSEITHVNVREANNVNVKVSVGTVVPTTVERFWMPVPREIVEIVPAWRTFRIVKVEGRLIVINPSTRKIVYVIES